ncbi:hypothetical protein HAX54_010838 [Datura stramonium]|uniref:Peptidylprolyl isomerase n=1 Tax=Datura stramonium TaxID=4076 RepID=A0ABS8TGV5_DATST|nr:hypothetical protein [Datura stramonium]
MRPVRDSVAERLEADDGEFGGGGIGGSSEVDDMCTGNHGPCLCDTWVFCGNKEACGDKFGECWLKKQKDTLAPDSLNEGTKIMWTSGIIFGKGETMLRSNCKIEKEEGNPVSFCQNVPHSLLLTFWSCAVFATVLVANFSCGNSRTSLGCTRRSHKDVTFISLLHYYITTSNSEQLRFDDMASFGPPYALLQGSLGAQNMTEAVPSEFCPEIRRGSVAWVGSGPEFFISLANHQEWKKSYTVFGYVLPEDM